MKELTIGTQSVPAPRTSVANPLTLLPSKSITFSVATIVACLLIVSLTVLLTVGISVPSSLFVSGLFSHRCLWCLHCAFIRQRSAGKGVRYD